MQHQSANKIFHKVIVYISVAQIGHVCSVSTDVPNRCPQPTPTIPVPPAFYYAHPDNCSYFFTCAHGTPYLMPCAPGTRFSEVLMNCVGEFTQYDTCSYVKNWCIGMCQSCTYRFQSCLGLCDGPHEHPTRLWTPYYIQCDTQRTINVSFCPPHLSGGSGFFSPVSKACVSIWDVPRETGYGLQPNCSGKADGLYRSDENPKVYYSCPGASVFYCPSGTEFNSNTQKCA
ncbi:hypothetical protein Btru_007639 [Bulinus truncatus]|nr:hypothetical protein Btru_007639 [Bulinus truncatus]